MPAYAPRFACMELMWGDVSGSLLEPWLDEVSSIGFTGVALRCGTVQPYLEDPERFSEMLASRGLRLAGAYAPIETSNAMVEAICGFLKRLDCQDLILHGGVRGGVPERMALARLLDDQGFRASGQGVRLGYHHHTHVPFETYEEIAELLRHTSPQRLHLFCDCGHATKDLIEFPAERRAYELLIRHWERVSYIEFKDWSADGEFGTDLGKGVADLRLVSQLIVERAYRGWIVLEQNWPSRDSTPRDSASAGLRFARGLFDSTADLSLHRR